MLWEQTRCFGQLAKRLQVETETQVAEAQGTKKRCVAAGLALAAELDFLLKLINGSRESKVQSAEVLVQVALHASSMKEVLSQLLMLLQAAPLSTLLYNGIVEIVEKILVHNDVNQCWSLETQQEALAAILQILQVKTNKALTCSSEAKESLRKMLCVLLALPHSMTMAWRIRLLIGATLSVQHSVDEALHRLLAELPSPMVAVSSPKEEEGCLKQCKHAEEIRYVAKSNYMLFGQDNQTNEAHEICREIGTALLYHKLKLAVPVAKEEELREEEKGEEGGERIGKSERGWQRCLLCRCTSAAAVQLDALTSGGIFYKTWFPEDAKDGLVVPGFWFGARKASYRSFFETLAADCVQPARTLAGVAGTRCALPQSHPDLAATARLRMKMAIFLDQTSRNYLSMQRGNAIVEATNFKVACDSVALPLALSVLLDVGFTARSLLQLGSVPELCFLSLVLRHAREAFSLKLSEHMLLSLLKAFAEAGGLLGKPQRGDQTAETEAAKAAKGHKSHQELCLRFLEETRDAMEAIGVEKYLKAALSSDKPIHLRGKPVHPPRLSVLDSRCHEYAGNDNGASLPFLSPLKGTDLSMFEGHCLVKELRKQLEDLGYLRADLGIVLSLSGGVDSMVTCCLLWLLQRTLPPEQRFRWCALHLCHPNRDDARDEEGWVQWSCSELGVDLQSYRPQIRRPHGNVRTGISREHYEEKSKQIRFRMYNLCLEHLGVPGAALVAHHEDDADENRLAELGKGNIVHIDGMSASGTTLGVTVLRPLLKVRKNELIEFARLAQICYMQDSTPKWSRRGWIRHVLDEMKLENPTCFSQLQTLLSQAGAASEALGETIDLSLNAWKQGDIFTGFVAVPPLDLSNDKRTSEKNEDASTRGVSYPACSVMVALLRMPALFKLSEDFQGKVQSLMEDLRHIAFVWNQAIARQAADDQEVTEEDTEQPGSCPLQVITVCDGRFEMGPFVLGRAMCVAMNAVSEARDANSLLLCDAEELATEFADVRWQRLFVNATTEFLQQHGLLDESNGEVTKSSGKKQKKSKSKSLKE
ncbi:unnamed protein product [Durusdinium trenchii]|uniref:tRNA(Ile)-lysidine synthetase n=1 Tax=Durusdinium trenchii TaxID=1381693 RepID=A0ABP0KSH2_9DINO